MSTAAGAGEFKCDVGFVQPRPSSRSAVFDMSVSTQVREPALTNVFGSNFHFYSPG